MKNKRSKTFVKEGDDSLRDTVQKLKSQVRRLKKENKLLKEENRTLEAAFEKSIHRIEKQVEDTPVEELIRKEAKKAESARERILKKFHPDYQE